ncbi:hypothetical protein PVAP13_4KG210005 [Panicum virgatum]|uniref:Uncharacterized protein n=1 Tax=Panicum virgatum TaxID=38727 RepID=A0A8T0TRI4_PANVG|nr:hypothetical protein PVAP13_4KG210005 [Panicum virgatum]
MFDPWRLLFFPMAFVVGADVIQSEGPSMRYVYLNLMRSGWWCCIPFWVLLLPRRWILVSRRRSSSSSSSLVWTSSMVFHRLHVCRPEFQRAVSCGASKVWGLLIGWEEVFSLSVFCALCFMSPRRWLKDLELQETAAEKKIRRFLMWIWL